LDPSNLGQFVPQELMTKLERARASGWMVGERRVVTLLFCDVKGSTAAAEQLDPEEWTEIINGAFEHMIKPVYNYEGTVARLMGDAILAFFGAPIAHEEQRHYADYANDHGEPMRFIEAADEFYHLAEELIALQLNAKHLAQLAANHNQRRAKDVADQNWLGQKVSDKTQPGDAGQQGQNTDEDCG
jgi:class 3 adenylate cyclase